RNVTGVQTCALPTSQAVPAARRWQGADEPLCTEGVRPQGECVRVAGISTGYGGRVPDALADPGTVADPVRTLARARSRTRAGWRPGQDTDPVRTGGGRPWRRPWRGGRVVRA